LRLVTEMAPITKFYRSFVLNIEYTAVTISAEAITAEEFLPSNIVNFYPVSPDRRKIVILGNYMRYN
jgi:hypothetical protein